METEGGKVWRNWLKRLWCMWCIRISVAWCDTPQAGTCLVLRPVGHLEPRGTLSQGVEHMQIPTGMQQRFRVVGRDQDQNEVPVNGDVSVVSNDLSMIDARVENGNEIVIGDNPATGTGIGTVTATIGDRTVTETVEIITGDLDAINLVATGALEPRTPAQ